MHRGGHHPPPPAQGLALLSRVGTMFRFLKRVVLVGLAAATVRWLLATRARHEQERGTGAPTIGGDTWPPVPVNPAGRG